MRNAELDAELLRTAKAQGHLEPILAYLNREIGRSDKPVEPVGPEWPYKRAYNDGVTAGGMKTLKWLEGMCEPSPDGAENTED